ncbi:MAG: hypothetical protein MJ072_04720, partial [Clostridia bacterium]|nr:hypothetical protein [Clostridia bacterium]
KRKKIFSKITVILVLISIFLNLSSCANVFSNEEAIEILKPLLEKEAEINLYVYADGYKTEEDPGNDVYSSYSKYYEVSKDSKYRTKESLENAMKEIFTDETFSVISIYAFNGYESEVDGETNIRGRFSQNKEGVIEIDVTREAVNLTGIAKISSIKVKRSNNSMIKAEIEIIREERPERNETKTVIVKKKDGIWKLDSQTLAVKIED